MTEGNTELNCRGALVIPDGFIIGEAAGGGDCFFDSVAQGMNELCIAGRPFEVEVLRQACFIYAEVNQGCIYDSQSHKTWRQAIEEDAVAGNYAAKNRQKQTYFHNYLVKIVLTATESSRAIWGRPEIEGRMLCQKYGIKLHIIENFHSSGQEVIRHQLVDSSGSRSLNEVSSVYNDPKIIHILNEGLCHFVPILRKTSVHKKPSKVKAHQAIGVRYVKGFSLTDNSTFSAVAAKKENADFRILRITNSPTISAALDFMKQAEFYETFNQASHWFFIVIEVADCSEFPSKAVECLAEVLDEQKPVIIQWDFMRSAEHLVLFKQRGQSAFTQIHINSISLFSIEKELILEMSKQGSFQLPLLLNALQLGIGGQFKGDALDLLNVSFDVKQEIDTWRLIDYAARDDDSLSLRFLLLVDWELAQQNGDGRRTLEIGAEYGGPQSLSALLNLPITCSEERHFHRNKEKEPLELRNGLGDNPLLIAAEKGSPETLRFLISCGVDIFCHRLGNEAVTAIQLAWDKRKYENVCVLLGADCPFPDEFDLHDIETSENTNALLKEVEDRRSFHQHIKDGLHTEVKGFIRSHPRLKQAHDRSNQSALMTALKAGQYELYALLQSEGLCAGKNEQLPVVIEGLTSEQKNRLKRAKLKYFGKEDDSHIIYLRSKSRLGIGQYKKKYFDTIRELYKQLDAIPEISTILKVVAFSGVSEIIFDFDNDSIADLDPTKSSETKGSCNRWERRIYVGAKDESTLPGTIAHELTHLAMQVCYDNECKPYEALDKQKECAFGKIVAEYREEKEIDDIIKRVFTAYEEESDCPKELIVRVPHVLAHVKEKGKQQLTQQVPKLLSFYKDHTEKDLERFIENPAGIENRHKIQRLNTLLEKMDEIEQYKLWLNDECLLKDDVINGQHIWILSSHLPLLTKLNLYQILRRKGLSLSDVKSDYIFVSAEQLRNQEKAICEAFQLVTHTTLIIEWPSQYDKSETDLWYTLKNFSENRRIIFIAVTDEAQSLQDMVKKYQAKMMHVRDYTWSDLITDSQNELLKKKVCFQGIEIPLNELVSYESPVTKFLPLADLLEKRPLEIGKTLLTSTIDGCIENYYIPRTFNHQVTIKKDIFGQKFHNDLLATTEKEFRTYCQDKREKNVHWLLEDKEGRYIWQQSQGSFRTLHKYIDTRNPLRYPPKNLDQFLQQAHCQKLMLIADTAGMGKTTVLTHLSKKIKQKFPAYWVIRIDLNEHTNILEAQAKQKIGTTEFLSEKVLKFRYPFEKELFKQCCQGLQEATKVVLMFDGFDEISPKYKETVLDLLQDLNPLKQPWIAQLWVTTRPHLREELEDSLHKLCYTLEPFTENNQVEFLRKFWQQDSKVQEGNQQKLETYARALVQKLTKSISDKEKEVTGIPLQTRMLAEAFVKEVESYSSSNKSEPEFRKELFLVDLYRKFIKEKIIIFFNSKGEIAQEQSTDIILNDISITKNHKKLALEVLLPEVKDSVLKLEEFELLAPEAINRIGIVQYVDKKPHFIHRTFAEYYVAEFLVTRLTRETTFLLEVLNILFKILLRADFMVIRLFLNGLLVNPEKSKVIKQYGKHIYEIWNVERTNTSFKINKGEMTRYDLQNVLRQAAYEGSAHIIDFIFSSLKATGNSETINKLLLIKDRKEDTAFHISAESGQIIREPLSVWVSSVHEYHKNDLWTRTGFYGFTAWDISAYYGTKEILDTLWGWGTEVQVNLKDDLLLAKGRYGLNAFQCAAMNGKKEILETLWGWGREVEVNLKDDLLLVTCEDGQTAFHYAAKNGNKEILETLWGWGRKEQVNLKDDLLLAKGKDGLTAFLYAANNGKKETLETLWGWGREVQVNLKDDLLLAKGNDGQTAFLYAANNGNKEILGALWCWGREVQVNLKDDLLLAKGNDGQTAFLYAANNGNKEILEALWCWGREVQVNHKDDLLLAKGYDGHTAFLYAANNGNKEILETLWGWGREVQVNLKDDLLLAKNKNGLTAFKYAAFGDNIEILETLCLWGREEQLNLKDHLFLVKGENGMTVWDIAAFNNRKQILEALWRRGSELQVNLKDDLLLAKGNHGLTAWGTAAMNGKKEILETLWCWGREVQVNLKDELLLVKGFNEKTAWDNAAMMCRKEILESLWGWGREVQVNLKDDLLLAKGKDGLTAWDYAAMDGKKEILETLWCWGREVQVNLKDELLLVKGFNEKTAWDNAAMMCRKEILESLWGWGREVQVNLKDDLLLAKGKDGLTAWDYAAMDGKKEILETLWCWGREVQVNLKDELLLVKGFNEKTAWDNAAMMCRKEILESLWGWGREVQVNLKDDLLLAKGIDGLTAWDFAAMNGRKEILETMWGWGREVQVNLKDDLLLAKGIDGLTAWDFAAMNGRKEILETLWCWGREVQVNLKDDLLLAKRIDGLTAWDIAAMNGRKEILETLWGWGSEVQVNLKDDLFLAKGMDGLTASDIATIFGHKELLKTLCYLGRELQLNRKDALLPTKRVC